MEIIFEALENTPFYVYLIFFYVLYSGISALKPRTCQFPKIFILPLILTGWTTSLIYQRWHQSLASLNIWWLSIAVGFFFGYWAIRFYKFYVDRRKGTIKLPASHSNLILGLLLFAVRYYFGYVYDTYPIIPIRYIYLDFTFSGILIGLFLGRAFGFYQVYTRRY